MTVQVLRQGVGAAWGAEPTACDATRRPRARRPLLLGLVVASLLLLCGGLVGLSDPGGLTRWAAPAPVILVIALLCGAVQLLCRWRLVGDTESGWLAAILLMLGLFAFSGLVISDGMTPAERSAARPLDALGVLLAVWMVRSGIRRTPLTGWRHPVLLGLAGGALLILLQIPALPEIRTPADVALIALLGMVVAGLAIRAVTGLGLAAGQALRWSGVLAVVLAVACRPIIPYQLPADVAPAVALTLYGLCCALLCATSLVLLHDAVTEHALHLQRLTERADRAEVKARDDEVLLHELRASVAGIGSASRLLATSASGIPAPRSDALQQMICAETDRLERLLVGSPAEPAGPVDLDRLLEPLVTAQQAQGVAVDYPRTGLSAVGSERDVALALNTLLCNAARHAPGAQVRITSEVEESRVCLRVMDDGPGVAEDVQARLFGHGAKAATSPGQGIGLYAARQALRGHGGDLRHEPSSAGTVFSMVLPR